MQLPPNVATVHVILTRDPRRITYFRSRASHFNGGSLHDIARLRNARGSCIKRHSKQP